MRGDNSYLWLLALGAIVYYFYSKPTVAPCGTTTTGTSNCQQAGPTVLPGPLSSVQAQTGWYGST